MLRILGVTGLVSLLGGLAGAVLGLLVIAILGLVTGLSVVVLEARDRLGGRAHTVRSGDFALDLGCGWLHSADENEWTKIAATLGFAASAILNVAVPVALATTLACSLLAALRLKRAYRPKQEALEAA